MPGPNPIMIRNVSHLTDARYFAAMGVDWMTIVLSGDPGSFSRWHAMRDWISGVRIAAEINSMDESLVAKTIIEANPDGIITDNLDIIHLTGGIELFLLTEKILPADKNYFQIIPYNNYNFTPEEIITTNDRTIFLEAAWTTIMIENLKQANYRGGFCFQTSGELAVGIKDFTEMDEVLELIRS